AIHPTSKDPKRTWPRKKFITLARNLQQEGYTVSFLVGPDEYAQWQDLSTEFFIPQCASLNDTAKHLATCDYFIGNDSGLGHLASNLHIPTLTIAGNPKQITYWRPAFSPGLVITIPFELPNFKGINFRLRDVFWQNFISVSRVRKAFNKLAHA
ncbi:MAG: glycosyltransferase family 9 protein, partial [Simkaniaceae bacterium]|nr:glycosyltransferase family 9 protein [Simkaniaceae bacterium]